MNRYSLTPLGKLLMNADSANVANLPEDNGHCPDCRGGEHHPEHDVSYMNLDHGNTAWCQCPCARVEHALAETILTRGTLVTITAGKMVGKTGHIVEPLPGRAMYIVWLDAYQRQHYVPNEWVQVNET